jgi:hypothetical protein
MREVIKYKTILTCVLHEIDLGRLIFYHEYYINASLSLTYSKTAVAEWSPKDQDKIIVLFQCNRPYVHECLTM